MYLPTRIFANVASPIRPPYFRNSYQRAAPLDVALFFFLYLVHFFLPYRLRFSSPFLSFAPPALPTRRPRTKTIRISSRAFFSFTRISQSKFWKYENRFRYKAKGYESTRQCEYRLSTDSRSKTIYVCIYILTSYEYLRPLSKFKNTSRRRLICEKKRKKKRAPESKRTGVPILMRYNSSFFLQNRIRKKGREFRSEAMGIEHAPYVWEASSGPQRHSQSLEAVAMRCMHRGRYLHISATDNEKEFDRTGWNRTILISDRLEPTPTLFDRPNGSRFQNSKLTAEAIVKMCTALKTTYELVRIGKGSICGFLQRLRYSGF